MGREEQAEEREVLDSIFPDEITDLSEGSFRVAIALEVEGSEDEDEPPTLWLTLTFPETYPDTAPLLDLSQPPNSPKHPDLDIQADKTRLLDSLTPTIEDNLGMQMVFTLISTLKDSAELLIVERQNATQAQVEMAAQAQEAKENEKFHGKPVTAESFKDWREMFVEEMNKVREKERLEREEREKKGRGGGGAGTVGVEGKEKMTGKMLWEKGLAGKSGEEEDEEGEDALKGVERLSVKA